VVLFTGKESRRTLLKKIMIWPLIKSKIPHSPGVYMFKDKNRKVLYVGKAVDLYQRVASYFQRLYNKDPKQKILIDQITDVQTITVESELEALILEANLIKKYLPSFNVRLTDDKDYLYIAINKQAFPKIVIARKKDILLMKKYWGPFPSSRTVRETIKSLRKVFPWCSLALQTKKRSRPCFYYHIGLCPGSCVGAISKKEYQKIITRFSKFMDGKKQQLIADLADEMKRASEKQEFEKAAKIKKVIEGIVYLTQINRTGLYLENPNFLQEEKQMALKELQKDLNLKKLPNRIEGYDISNIQGCSATGSMVVLTEGEIDKSQYRKFKISLPVQPAGSTGSVNRAKQVSKPNDVAMMREVLRRRLKHSEWPLPDLVLVDGGRGQVCAVKQQMSGVKYQIPVYGLAKKAEWLYPPGGEVIKLPRKSLSLKLLQKLRDEAHRFALNYYRKLHQKANLNII